MGVNSRPPPPATRLVLSIILLLVCSAGCEELNLAGDGTDSKDNECDKSRVGCSLSASLKGHLDATNSVMNTLHEMLISAKYKIQELESHTCQLPELDARNLVNPLVAGKDSSNGCASAAAVPPSVANCFDIKQRYPLSTSGIFQVSPRYLNRTISVYCDMDTGTGGWTVIQRRNEYGTQENFYRNWEDYKQGFGNLERDFWLGNDAIFALSNEKDSVLRIELEDFSGNKRYAIYSTFEVSTERRKYKITVSDYEGDAGDSMKRHQGQVFSTFEQVDATCARRFKGGWWYEQCHDANLNGLYLKGNHTSFADGVNWRSWMDYHYSLKKSEMKTKPRVF